MRERLWFIAGTTRQVRVSNQGTLPSMETMAPQVWLLSQIRSEVLWVDVGDQICIS